MYIKAIKMSWKLLCVAFTLIVVGAQESGGVREGCCPDAWMAFDGSCYFFADNIKLSWSEAAHFCQLRHSELVVIDHRKEDLFLQDHAMKLFRNVADRHAQTPPAFWTGGTDETVEGIWTWYTDNSDLVYKNWYPGQPSTGGTDEDCLGLYGYYNFTWHDVSCTKLEYPLCELKLSGSSSIVG